MSGPAWQLTATELGRAYAGGLSPMDVLAETQERIERLDGALNAYTARNPAAMAEAAASAVRWRERRQRSPLDGVPLIVKDNLHAAGMPSAWGNAALGRRVAAADELPVGRLRAAGMVVTGKGNTPEFAVEGYTDNLTFGTTRNPFDTRLTPGGSSGGVVAAVAAGMAHIGIGTDGGGSIRRPAGYTGLVGLKPGIGHAARAGGLPQVLLDFEVVGPLARCVADAAALDAILTEAQPPAAFARPRVLYVPRLGDAPCSAEILGATATVAAALSDLGADVTEGPLPFDLAPLNAVWTGFGEIGLARLFADDPIVAEAAAPKYREMAARGAARSAPDLYAMLSEVYALREAVRAMFNAVDVVLTPSSAAMPWTASEPFPPTIDGDPVGPRGHAVYTGWVNAAGVPGLAMPAPTAGLPIGVQLVGGGGSEAKLLSLGASLEAALGGFRWPALNA